MGTEITKKRRFQIIELEEKIAPAAIASALNGRGFHGSENATTGLQNAAAHSSNPVVQAQLDVHAPPPPPPPPPNPNPTVTPPRLA